MSTKLPVFLFYDEGNMTKLKAVHGQQTYYATATVIEESERERAKIKLVKQAGLQALGGYVTKLEQEHETAESAITEYVEKNKAGEEEGEQNRK